MKQLSGFTFLVVEDWPGHARLLEMALREVGLENPVVHVTSGEAALAHLSGESGDLDRKRVLVFLDMTLPGISGEDVLAEIRKGGNGSRVPVVLMSAVDLPEERRHCATLDCDGFLTKPPPRDMLATLLQDIADRRH